MSLNALGMGFLFTATDLASGVMDRVQGNLESLTEASGRAVEGLDKQVKGLGAGLVGVAIGMGGLKAATALADKAAVFEAALVKLGNAADATDAELAMLRETALKVGSTTEFTPTEALMGMRSLAQAGFNVREQMDLLTPSLLLASASMGALSPEEAAGLASQAMKAFGIDTQHAGLVVDQMVKSAGAFAMEIDDLPLGLGAASRGAQLLNQSMTETLVAFGMIKDVIPGTERAATAASVAMERLANPKVQAALKKSLGVDVIDKATGGFRVFGDILSDMAPKLNEMEEGQRAAFLESTFGSEGLAGLNAILTRMSTGVRTANGELIKGGAVFKYFRDQVIDSAGTTQKASDKYLATYEGQKKLLAGSLETLAIQIGEPFKDALAPALQLTVKALTLTLKLIEQTPGPLKKFGAIAILAGFSMMALGGGILVVKAGLPLLKLGLASAAKALWGFATAAWSAMLPFLPWILGLVVLGALIYDMTNDFHGLRFAWKWWKEEFEKNAWVKALTIIIGGLAVAIGGTYGLSWAIGVIVPAIGRFVGALQAMWATMLANPVVLIGVLLAMLTFMIIAISNNWFGLGDDFKLGCKLMLETVTKWVADVVNAIDGMFAYLESSKWGRILLKLVPGAEIGAAATKALAKQLNEAAQGEGTVSGTRGMGATQTADPKLPEPPAGMFSMFDPEQYQSSEPVSRPLGGRVGRSERAPLAAAEAAAQLAETQAALESRPDPGMSIDYDLLAKAVQSQPIVIRNELDGDQLSSSVSRINRSNAARSSLPVGAE